MSPNIKRRTARLLGAVSVVALAFGLLPISPASADHPDPPEALAFVGDACRNTPGDFFTDDEGSIHEDAINCIAFYRITTGKTATTYAPADSVRRDQMATFIANLIDYAAENGTGQALPAAPATNPFPCPSNPDLALSPANSHYDNILRLAEAGIVAGGVEGNPSDCYGPSLNVRRDQMATFIVDGLEYSSGVTIVATLDYFVDDEESVHEGSINAGASEGLISGRGEDNAGHNIYEPFSPIRRDQMAAFLARALQYLVDQGIIAPRPPDPGEAGAATALSLTPDTDINPVGSNHTVTANLTDAEGDPAAEDTLVRFEVYRDADPGAGTGSFAFVIGGFDTSTGGTADFTYTGPAVNAQDAIVSCVVPNQTTSCTSPSGTLTRDPVSGQFNNINSGVNDTAAKEWTQRQATALALTPETDVNPVGQPHTVTARVTDQFGEPVPGDRVVFQVFRDTDFDGNFAPFGVATDTITGGTNVGGAPATNNPSGEATFTFTGDQGGLYRVVACTDENTDNVCATAAPAGGAPATGNGPITLQAGEPAIDTADKEYVSGQAATAGTFTGTVVQDCVAGTATTPGTVGIFTADGRFLILNYGGGDPDVYTVDGVTANEGGFTTACSPGDTLNTTYNPAPGVQSTFNLTNA